MGAGGKGSGQMGQLTKGSRICGAWPSVAGTVDCRSLQPKLTLAKQVVEDVWEGVRILLCTKGTCFEATGEVCGFFPVAWLSLRRCKAAISMLPNI